MTDAASFVSAGDDFVEVGPQSWIVVGWFTEDYRDLARRLAANLREIGAPFHLFSVVKERIGFDEIILMKPRIILKARQTYPDRVALVLDVDVHVRGKLDGITEAPGDIALSIKAKPFKYFLRPTRWRLVPSSRAMVIKPTRAATALIEAWHRETSAANRQEGDENPLARVMAAVDAVSYSVLDERFAARELREAPPDAVIVHESASDQAFRHGWKARLLGYRPKVYQRRVDAE